ncbi:MAG: cytochrome c oxidase assembly protein [Candidatus Symbiobacter sp.]|nr:cytochrome c oxidase assembly protein [Candidatus Symbiobacter sp.]
MDKLTQVPEIPPPPPGDARRKNQKLTLLLGLSLVAVMLGLSFASSPFYRYFCRVTGFAGTPLRASDLASATPAERALAEAAAARNLVIRFNGNVEPDLDWRFQPTANETKIKVGENAMAYFEAENLTDQPITGIATFNVTPYKAAPYVVKIACFCFTQQTLAPHVKISMPILYYIDPKINQDRTLDDVTNITLSYSFFRASEQAPPKFRKI